MAAPFLTHCYDPQRSAARMERLQPGLLCWSAAPEASVLIAGY
jgi:hypothetical protein